MRQVLQYLGSGETALVEVPCPGVQSGSLLIRSRTSLVSIGTEKMLIAFGKAGWLAKAQKQPDKVRQVFEKVKTDGLLPTIEAVKAKLDQPIPLGYANVGEVVEVGGEVAGFAPGDRAVSNGPHAEYVAVPRNLCARVPDGVSDSEAAFTVVGAIGLQGIRLVQPSLGEAVAVTGLGLIGLLCVQLLRAHGCRVLGIDFDSTKCALARQFGAETVDLSKGEDPVAAGLACSRGRGMDAVLITASTQSNDPVHQAAQMCRKRGRIVLVGVVGLELARADFYEKELSFQVSCSYGPGRYDEEYEQKGRDYPVGFVRWTEQRNFEAILDMMADKRIDVMPLISHRFQLGDALAAYGTVGTGKALGILIEYPRQSLGTTLPAPQRVVTLPPATPPTVPQVVVGVIGAGNFTGQVLLPALAKTGARLKMIASATGVTSTHLGQKFGFEQSTTEAERIFADPEINTVIITTRHNSHARYVLQGLKAGKRVYVEKPLCLTVEELEGITTVYDATPGAFVAVGFNRRFAPQTVTMKRLLAGTPLPKAFVMSINAGAIPASHWAQDSAVGGGRMIGEGCHFVDLLRYLAGQPIASTSVVVLGTTQKDSVIVSLEFADGSIGTVHYLANGHKGFPKERLEVYAGGRVLVLDNFQKLTGHGWPGFSKQNLWRQDKGHGAEIGALVEAVKNGKESPIAFGEIVEVMRTTIGIAAQMAAR